MQPRLLLLLLCLLAAAPLPGVDAGALIARAEREGVAEEPAWLALLHYAQTWRGRRSVVTTPGFFLAADGDQDPAAELRADLAALLAPRPAEGPAFTERFPARTEWLCRRLGLDREALPVPRAETCERVLATFKARGATLAFASGYLSAPASAFGHTLLVVRNRFDSLQLAQAVNHAAATDTTNGVVFAVRGVFGGYDGYFSLLPYYEKIGEYTDIDQRDLWEYDLALDEAEVRMLLLHIWELRDVGSTYYFFDANCSWRLLFLLDVARPGLGLRDRLRWWVLPMDTVRAVRDAGLVTAVRHRPSRMTRVRQAGEDLGEDAEQVRALAEGTLDPAAVQGPRAARILDTAAEYLQSRLASHDVTLEDYRPRLHAILRRRATLGARPAEAPQPLPPRPDQGHASGRVAVGLVADEHEPALDLGLRPAYHDPLDPGAGFDPGTRIAFADLRLRWRAGGRPDLHRLDAIGISSLSAWDRLYHPWSYTIAVGALREPDADGEGWRHRLFLDGGPGLALGGPALLGYALVEVETRVGLHAPVGAVGAGPTLGLLSTPVPWWSAQVVAALHPGIAGERVGNGRLTAAQRFHLLPGWSLGLDASRARIWGVDRWEVGGSVLRYW